MTNISLNEYIRRRKISLAVADLQNSKERIIDITLKYGYDSPAVFNRIFQSIHEIAPSLVRKKCPIKVISYFKIFFFNSET